MARTLDYHNSLIVNKVSFPRSYSCILAFTPNVYCVSVINFDGRYDFSGHILGKENFLVISLTEPILKIEEYLLFKSMLDHPGEYTPKDYPVIFAMRDNAKDATNEAYTRYRKWNHGRTTDFDVIEFVQNVPFGMPQYRSFYGKERSFPDNVSSLRALKELEEVKHTVRIDSLVESYFNLLGE